MDTLYIFDGLTEGLVAIFKNDNSKKCPFFDPVHTEQLNKDHLFEFSVPSDHEDSVHVNSDALVGFKDIEGDLQLFQIYKTEEEHDGIELQTKAYAEHVFFEMNDDTITDLRTVNDTAESALTDALSSSRWVKGTVADLGLNTTNFYYESAVSSIQKILNTWGGELKQRIVTSGSSISSRIVDILARRGADTGKRFTFTKDLNSIKRTIVSQPKTALYGRGKGEQTETGGYTRRITFADVVWSVANGDPVDKPAGQEWVGDPDALANFGRENGIRHRTGVFEDGQEEDPEILLQKTWNQLQEIDHPKVTYEMNVIDLERVSGLDHEAVRLGDSVFVIDKAFTPAIKIEARVIEIKRDLENPDNTEIVLGNFIPLFTDNGKRLKEIESKLDGRTGVWDEVEDVPTGPVTDEDFEDTIPPKPTVTAAGAFSKVILEWDAVFASYMKHYEIYASTVPSFTPDSSNLAGRTLSSFFEYEGQPNQQYYFKVRGINKRGTIGPFSDEVSDTTARIMTDDLADLLVTAQKLAAGSVEREKILDDAIDSAKLAAQAVQNEHLMNGAVNNDKLDDLAVTAAKLAAEAVGNDKIDRTSSNKLVIGTADIGLAAITEALIGEAAIGTAAIQDLAVTNAKIQRLNADKVTVGAGTDFDADYDPTTKETPTGAQEKADAAEISAKMDGGWTKTYSVNTATPKELVEVDGTGLSDAYSYDVVARTVGTGTESTSISVFKSNGDGNGWSLEKVYEMGTSSNHPEFFIDSNGKPSIRLYGHTSFYGVEVKASRFRGRQIPSNITMELWKYPNTTFIDGGNIYTNSVTANQMATGAITAASGIIADAAITSALIAEAAVGSAAIADLAVGSAHIQDLAVNDAKIESVNADKIVATTLSAISANLGSVTAGDMTGVSITSSDGAGNDVVLDNGIIESFRDGFRIARISNTGIWIYSDDGITTGNIRDAYMYETNDKGLGIVGYQDYVTLGFDSTGSTSKPWITLHHEDKHAIISGSNIPGYDSGRLYLKSTEHGNTANGKIPEIRLFNYLDSSANRWSNVMVLTGRDNSYPDNGRFGFEVWQYRGTGDGANEQLMKIDSDSEGTYTGIYTDEIWLPKKTMLNTESNGYFNALGMDIADDVKSIHGSVEGNLVQYYGRTTVTITASQPYDFIHINFGGAENIYGVICNGMNSNSVYHPASVYNITSTGFDIYIGQTEDTGNEAAVEVQMLVIYEPD